MDPFATTVVTNLSRIEIDQGSQVKQWALLLGVTELELRNAVDAVGNSVDDVSAYFGKSGRIPSAASDAPQLNRFANDPDAMRACQLIGLLYAAVYQRDDVREELTHLVAKLAREIKRGTLKLDYRPHTVDTVSIPAFDHPLYVQALMYWRIRLETTIESLAEACARLGDDPSVVAVRAMLKTIRAEERKNLTDFGGFAMSE